MSILTIMKSQNRHARNRPFTKKTGSHLEHGFPLVIGGLLLVEHRDDRLARTHILQACKRLAIRILPTDKCRIRVRRRTDGNRDARNHRHAQFLARRRARPFADGDRSIACPGLADRHDVRRRG